MQLHEVEAFLAVIRFGSITEAANSLHLTQPSLSHRIQMLEDSLGTSLFLRGKGQRRIELTEAGQRFIRQICICFPCTTGSAMKPLRQIP